MAEEWPAGLWRSLRSLWDGLRRVSRRAPHRLRLCESLPLGERRFVAVVEFEDARFLLGGTPASLVLLARLEDGAPRETAADTEPNLGRTQAKTPDQIGPTHAT